MPNQDSVAQLLNTFTIRVFNADYTQIGSPTSITVERPNANDNWARWTPTAGQWATISAAIGVKHYSISGEQTAEYVTGDYWSRGLDFEIIN